MAYDFPNSPSNNDTVTVNGVTYIYNSTSGAWKTSTAFSASVSETAPNNPGSGNLWFDPNSLETYVYYNDGDSNQWVQTNPSGGSTGLTVYSSIDNLPLSGVETGAQAFVSSTNRLYLWNGTGWYNIALINTTPSISGASSAYTLAPDGTATTVTITATDDEGIPITYSIASDTSGNIATVSQGTGSNTNVFTITPSTTTTDAGTFTLTFRASDGVNIATAVSSFTLEFIVEDSKYTTAMITSVGANNAVNNSFNDASTNNHTVTANGDVTQNTFSPYRSGGYSTYFDGTGDYIRYTDASLADGTGDFTVEFWIRRIGTQAQNDAPVAHGATPGWQVCFNTSNDIVFMKDSVNRQLSTGTLTEGQWYHVVYQRASGTVQGFLDGVSLGTIGATANFSNTTIEVGVNRGGTAYYSGNLRDVRIIHGTAFYSSSGFTPPTEPLEAVSGTGYSTALLTCHLPYIADGGANSLTPTVNGNTKVEPLTPYDFSRYTSSTQGGSIFLDGTSGYVSGDMTADLAFGTDDMTLECWVYPNTISGSDAIFDTRTSAFTGNAFTIQLEDGVPHVFAGNYSNSTPVIEGTSAVPASIWTHIAFSRSSGTNTLFINGTSVATNTNSWNQSFSSTNDWAVGETPPTATPRYFDGHISDFRIVKGTAVYTSAFTPPTAPLAAITNTSLLLSATDAGIIDKSQSAKTLTLTGDVQSSSTQTKNSSTSIKFDGTGDKIEIPDFQLLRDGRDFTIEFWIYLTDTSAERNILETFSFGASSGWTIYHLSGGRLDFYPYHTNMTTLSATTWTHIAIENYGGTIKCFVNGTSTYSTTHSTTSTPTAGLRIGTRSGTSNYFNGYMEDIRITDGYARYQGTNFTAPTVALQG